MISQALVLAAGKSTRIASVSDGRPKPLLPVGGRPVITRTLAWLAEFDVRDVWINLHYRPDEIRAALGDGTAFGVRIQYSLEPEILGTAGAFRLLAPKFSGTTLVVYGDNLMRFDLDAFCQAHSAGGADATLALFDPDVHANSRIAGGRVKLDAAGRVASFVEGADASARYVNAGAYLMEGVVARTIAPGIQDFGKDVFPALAASQRLMGHIIERSGYCVGIDTPESYRIAEELVAAHQVVLT